MHRLRALLLGLALALTVLPLRAGPPDILLANVYRDGIDVSQYLVSEKLDGVRAIWDGELWLGRGRFERLSGIVRREVPVDEEWRAVRYMIFELPGGEGSFRERAARIETLVGQAGVPWLAAVQQEPVSDRASLQAKLAAVLKQGGEGLMLHRADAPYESGRSDTLLKLKPWLDAEAVVTGHLLGKGKYAGQLGALRVRLPDGRLFRLGTGFTDAQRRQPPPVGSTVTYRYRELTASGLPRFASFLRIREE